MTYFDWKYYKELLIGNKELGKVQGEFTVVVIKIKNNWRISFILRVLNARKATVGPGSVLAMCVNRNPVQASISRSCEYLLYRRMCRRIGVEAPERYSQYLGHGAEMLESRVESRNWRQYDRS
uniref:Uncharacterized protein n=1 Tax=Magallana gigas TaxID=29159 RepID=K1R9K4_MAGGI